MHPHPHGRHRPHARRCLPRRLGTALVVAAVLTGFTLLAVAGAGAQPPAPPPRAPPAPGPPEPTIAELVIIDTTLRLYKIKADLVGVDKELADVSTRLVDAEKALAETEAKLSTAKLDMADLRERLQGRAAVVYPPHGAPPGMAPGVNRVGDLSAGNHYAESVAVVDNREIERLEHLVAELQAEREK